MSSSNYVHIEIEEVVRETENAFLVLYEGDEYWIPRSQVSDPEDYTQGDVNCTMSITKWIADKHGIEAE